MVANDHELPQIAGLFVSAFHAKEGYKIIWQAGETDLSGCEYKTLPSGIDKVQEDVVYFTHKSCIGLAAYRNLQTSGQAREEFSCISVAILVLADTGNLRHQRLNKVWLFNTILQDFAEHFDLDSTEHKDLKDFYETHKNTLKRPANAPRAHSPPASPVLSKHSSFKNYQSFRSERQTTQAKTTSLLPAQELSNLHPVLSLHDCISLFGPLIFPVFRAALARKRILVVTEAPVQRACHFIYNIQLLSAIPNNATIMRRPSPLRQLFCLGLSDVGLLESLQETGDAQQGWIGVTTDQIYETKTDLWDVLIRLPSESSSHNLANERARPTLTSSDGTRIMTSYLDALNFNKLKPFLPLYRDTGLKVRPEPSFKRSILDSIVSGFWYWASSGQSLELDDDIYLEHTESSLDELEDDHGADEDRPLIRTKLSAAGDGHMVSNGLDEVIVLVIFHRLTTNIMSLLDELCCESADELSISREQMVKIGLTPRLQTDVNMVEDLGRRWFGRDVSVDKSFWPCC